MATKFANLKSGSGLRQGGTPDEGRAVYQRFIENNPVEDALRSYGRDSDSDEEEVRAYSPYDAAFDGSGGAAAATAAEPRLSESPPPAAPPARLPSTVGFKRFHRVNTV